MRSPVAFLIVAVVALSLLVGPSQAQQSNTTTLPAVSPTMAATKTKALSMTQPLSMTPKPVVSPTLAATKTKALSMTQPLSMTPKPVVSPTMAATKTKALSMTQPLSMKSMTATVDLPTDAPTTDSPVTTAAPTGNPAGPSHTVTLFPQTDAPSTAPATTTAAPTVAPSAPSVVSHTATVVPATNAPTTDVPTTAVPATTAAPTTAPVTVAPVVPSRTATVLPTEAPTAPMTTAAQTTAVPPSGPVGPSRTVTVLPQTDAPTTAVPATTTAAPSVAPTTAPTPPPAMSHTVTILPSTAPPTTDAPTTTQAPTTTPRPEIFGVEYQLDNITVSEVEKFRVAVADFLGIASSLVSVRSVSIGADGNVDVVLAFETAAEQTTATELPPALKQEFGVIASAPTSGTTPSPPAGAAPSEDSDRGILIGVAAACGVLVLVLVGVLFWRSKSRGASSSESNGVVRNNSSPGLRNRAQSMALKFQRHFAEKEVLGDDARNEFDPDLPDPPLHEMRAVGGLTPRSDFSWSPQEFPPGEEPELGPSIEVTEDEAQQRLDDVLDDDSLYSPEGSPGFALPVPPPANAGDASHAEASGDQWERDFFSPQSPEQRAMRNDSIIDML